MIKLLKQTSEFYCSTEVEAEEILSNRKEESLGRIIKTQIEAKDNYVKLSITEEYDTFVNLEKERKQEDEENDIEYYDMLDEENRLIEYTEEEV